MRKLVIVLLFTVVCLSSQTFNIWDEIDEVKQKLMIEYINLKQSQWTAGETFNTGALNNYKRYLGVKLNSNTQLPTKTDYDKSVTIPASFDSRQQWPNCQSIKTIRDQGNCGSCWAVSAVEAMSDRICIFSNQTQQVYVSAENVVACVPNGCEGGDPGDAWQYYIDNGIPTGAPYGSKTGCQPYSFTACGVACQKEPFSPTPSCSSSCISGYNKSYKQSLYYGNQSYNVDSDVSAIQQEIMTNGPVQATMDVYQDFMTYKSGVYAHVTGDYLGGHAIKIIGWGVQSGVAYWLCANSWDVGFGINGYFMIQRGTDECGIEDGITAGTPLMTSSS